MPAVAARAVVATTVPNHAARHALRKDSLLAPAAVLAVAAYRYKDVIADRSSHGSLKPVRVSCSKEKKFSHLSTASISLFGDENDLLHGVPRLPTRRRSPELSRAYKSDFFRLPLPVIAEKPEWWWRTLASLPYLFALYMSDTGNFIQPFLEHYDYFGLVYFVPGAVSRLPTYFPMFYYTIALFLIVKNNKVPHFFRFHLMMGMLLETALQVVWYTSNFFPIIHFNGTLGMYYWAGVGFAYMLMLLQCVRCALAGAYAQIPFISDAALVHTLFNIGGFQRPF
ncbi:protein TIC 20-IV, chloroplastic isoform X2 [Mercurialis annua]|uniref:protein TIC 20-IV, chloroplastic isoform X2 n=1 Tax=Mercurialis annua TaxID=3986 RepID=UPI00215FD446|nr:protein TIC 20-IV, chloroplastic isoform X2 [Mercurialis annua]